MIGLILAAHTAVVYFLITTQPHERGFVVGISDPATIAQARKLIHEGQSRIVTGIIATNQAPYNVPWGFHYLPNTVRLADMTTEVCDATATYVQAHLKDVGKDFLPDNRWCPWHTRLVREVR
jgi:hypothetical protein